MGQNELEMPSALIRILASPADLTILDREKIAEQLRGVRAGLVDASDRPALERFIALIEDGLGFTLYESVEAAKRRLSEVSTTVLDVEEPSIAFSVEATRKDLESTSDAPVTAIVEALDRALEAAGMHPDDVEILCLTGGTSRMPLVVERLAARLRKANVRRLASFHSVVTGLAKNAQRVAREAS
jgi:hypothetical chaperone protein